MNTSPSLAPMLGTDMRRTRYLEVAAHVVTWAYIFASPLFFQRGDSINWVRFLNASLFSVAACLIFYLNYFLLIPRYFLQRRYSLFLLINLAMVAGIALGLEIYSNLQHNFSPPQARRMGMRRQHISTEQLFLWKSFFVVRNAFLLITAIAISLALRLSLSWHKAEMERRKAEVDRQAAELKNLKNQISPHFLLNTLNNIYALTTFDTERAQHAILELGKLLRYLLYDNQVERVPLSKEVEFLHNYIELMRLRIGKNVDLQVDLDIPQDREVNIAPLIFISLVENAFKHGICPTQPSFIHISLRTNPNGDIVFTCTNSNFPKTADDKSGGGIGLQQVSQRLALSYPNRHTWHKGVKDGVYTSCITLKGE